MLIIQRNPNIKLYGLPWGFPGWLGQGTLSPYAAPEVTADYVIKWISGAKTVHNLTIDFVGVSVLDIVKELYDLKNKIHESFIFLV